MRTTIVLIIILLIPICIMSFTQTQIIQAQKAPVTFTLGWVGVIKFNPFAGYAYGIYRSALYGTLFRYDENLNPVPWVAEKYERVDPTTVIVYLRKDVKWHDGKPFTAEDVKFTFDLILKYKGAMSRFMTGVKEAVVRDSYTLEVRLKEPIGPLPWLTSVYFVPKHIWTKNNITDEKCLTYEYIPPVGYGPFKFVEWKPGEYLVLEAFNEFFAGKPKIDRLVVRLFAEHETMIAAFRAKELDAIAEIPAAAIPELEKISGVKVIKEVIPRFDDIYINLAKNGSQHPALLDREVRWALLHAIDVDYLINNLYYGAPVKAFSIIPPSFGQYYAKEYEDIRPKFNLTKAAEILEKAGYVDKDGDGIRETRDGKPLRFRFWVYNGFPLGARVAEIIRDWWHKIGVDIDYVLMEGGVLWDKVSKTKDWDLAMWGWTVHDESSILYAWTSEAAGVYSSSWLQDAKYDEMYHKQLTTLNNEERAKVIKEMQKYIIENVYDITLWYTATIEAYWASKWEGIISKPGGAFRPYGHNSLMYLNIKLKEETITTTPTPSYIDLTSTSLIAIILIAVVVIIAIVTKKRKRIES